jgi:hypothetical protein
VPNGVLPEIRCKPLFRAGRWISREQFGTRHHLLIGVSVIVESDGHIREPQKKKAAHLIEETYGLKFSQPDFGDSSRQFKRFLIMALR